MKQQQQIPVTSYHSKAGFLHRYQELVRSSVIPYQYAVMNDAVEGVEKSHVIANFINAGRALRGEDIGDGFYGMVFQDSDAAKWLEAVGYSLAVFPNEKLEAQADALIEQIAQAQDTDGYLNTCFTIKDRDRRWQNLLEGHELYCAGHMMEAAAAYFEATGKRRLLDVMERNAEHIYDIFITQGHEGYPGHPEVELALLKLYRATGNPHCLELARHFIDTRGVDKQYYEKEKATRNWTVWGNNPVDYDYQQSGKPVRAQHEAVGHSVRAVYLYTGMADLAAQTQDAALVSACKALWDSVTQRRMYLTGAIGSTVHGEAFTTDFDLPNDTVYGETCASVGLMFFASRMLELEADSAYADIMERAFYNTVLAGMSLDGTRFFYVNPLEVVPGISGTAVTHKHDLPQRPGWYACACCPPNVARLITGFGKYAYGENDTTGFCHLFADGEIVFQNGLALSCETDYPYGFTVRYAITAGSGKLAVRIPNWSMGTSILQNGKAAAFTLQKGYAYLDCQAGDTVTLTLDDSVKRVYASPRVPENTGCVALQRGPLVYCAEGTDNGGAVLPLSLSASGRIEIKPFDSTLLGGVVPLAAEGWATPDSGGLYTMQKPQKSGTAVHLIPYYTWGNRGETQMRVWLPEV